MVTAYPLRELPDGIIRWRLKQKRDDGSWEVGEWVDGAPPWLPPKAPPGSLLEYDLRQLRPRQVTILGDTVREWSAEDLDTDPPAFLGERIVAGLRSAR
jgi:hypothetical protein